MEKKKTSLLILGLSILLLSFIGVTYAYWNLNLQQKDEDNLTTSCFDVELLEEGAPIQLEKAYPILDEEGEKLTPYTFTLTNKCNANVKYQINLESLNKLNGVSIKDKRLNSQYIKEKLNETGKDGSINILTDNPSVEKTLDEAVESYKLQTGYMKENDEKNFELRLWLRGDLTIEDEEAMNKTFASKITIVATYAKEVPQTLEETILALERQKEDSGVSGLYEVDHKDASITYTKDEAIIERLQQPEYRYAGAAPNNYVDVGERYTNDVYKVYIFGVEPLKIIKEETVGEIEEYLRLTIPLNVIFQVNLKPNEEENYFLEYRDTETGLIEGMQFNDSEECESSVPSMQESGYTIVTECIVPENYYELYALMPYNEIEYNSESECLAEAQSIDESEGDIDISELTCKVVHSQGEPIYWRIIGLVNTPEGQRVKLIKDESIGEFSWDTSDSSVNDGHGVNEWSQSDLMKLLNPGYEKNRDQICSEIYEDIQCIDNNLVNNSLYWNGEDGQCYNDWKNKTHSCNFTNHKMSNNLKNMIENVTWNTGSYDEVIKTYDNINVYEFYNIERSSNTGKICDSNYSGCNDKIKRTTSWKGKIGLIYPSDYGYATSGGTLGRKKCFSSILYEWYDNEYETECAGNDWFHSGDWYWTLSPSARDVSDVIFRISASRSLDDGYAGYAVSVRPSVYLKSKVYVKQGNGSKDDPYVLEG